MALTYNLNPVISGIAAERGATNVAEAAPNMNAIAAMPYMFGIKGRISIETPLNISALIIITFLLILSAKTPAIGPTIIQGTV